MSTTLYFGQLTILEPIVLSLLLLLYIAYQVINIFATWSDDVQETP